MHSAVNEMQRGERFVVLCGGHSNSTPARRRCVIHPPVTLGITAVWLPFLWGQGWHFLILAAVELLADIAEQKPKCVDSDCSSDRKARRRNHAADNPGDLRPRPTFQQRVSGTNRRNGHRHSTT